MNTSEQIGKVATSTVEALKSTPVVLALVVFNVLFVVLMSYAAVKISGHWDHEIERWVEFARACQNVSVKPKSEP